LQVESESVEEPTKVIENEEDDKENPSKGKNNEFIDIELEIMVRKIK
jgi:hypothetical protein